MNDTFLENLYKDVGYAQCFSKTKSIYKGKSEFQDIEIFENPHFGRVLVLDGAVQLTTKDEFCYHEMMVHVPLFSLDNPKNVLIIGAGDGGILREVLNHKTVEKATLVEIDSKVVELSKEFFPEVSNGAFQNTRANVIIGDGCKYVAESKEIFDAILIDSTDPVSVGEGLFTEEFYRNCKKILKNDGIIITQSGVPFMQIAEAENMQKRLKKVWEFTGIYTTSVPTYTGGVMALGIASSNDLALKPNLDNIKQKFKQANITTKYYNPETHIASFLLPEYIKNVLK